MLPRTIFAPFVESREAEKCDSMELDLYLQGNKTKEL
jgi:hypothetical protein